jgi:dihydrofolate reductase
LGGPLPNRHNVVLTSSPERLDLPAGAEAVASLDEARGAAEDAADRLGVDTVYVVGGATVYEQFLPDASRLVLTELDEAYAGDTVFPAYDEADWTEVDRDARDGFAFVTYERV